MHVDEPADVRGTPTGECAELLDRLFHQPVLGVAEVDVVGGRFLRVSPRLAAWVGVAPDAVERLDPRCVLPPDDWAEDVDQRRRLAAGEVSEVTARRRFVHRSGSMTSVTVSVSALWLPGDPPGSALLVADEPVQAPAQTVEESVLRQGSELLVAMVRSNVRLFQAAQRERTERTRMEGELRRLEWMLSKGRAPAEPPPDSTGDRLVALNRCRVLLDAVGKEMLDDIVGDFLDLLDTAAAVYEQNGDYALGRHSSRWCTFLHESSRRICPVDSDRAALDCGQWHCHESCWTAVARHAIETGETVDRDCVGGLRVFGVPIRAGAEIVGSISVGYGDPPRDPARLQALSATFGVPVAELERQAAAYESRPPYIIELAKRRAIVSARLIGAIVERRRAKLAAQQSLALLEGALAESPSGILIADAPNVTIRWANAAALQIRGASERPLTQIDVDQHSTHWQTLRPDGSPYPSAELPLSRAVLKGEVTHNEEVIIRHADGEDRWVSVNAAPIRNRDGVITAGIVVFHDITARRRADAEQQRLQMQLTQAQKMESVGRLAGGVAHDFNNALQVILGNAVLARHELHPEHPLHEYLTEIETAAERSADLTRQLLTFARKQPIAPRLLNLNATVDGMLKMLRRLIGEHIELCWSPGADLWPIEVDPSQLDQVLANLTVNARDAIAGGGRILLETANVTLDAGYSVEQAECIPGDYVLLAVSDTGQGMDAETRTHLFEPFYTTKSKGTGLGLATVFGIVKQNRGLIHVYSEPGQGTTFRIYLPRASGTIPPVAPAPMAVRAMGSGETILLVEDEQGVLDLARRILEQQGYRVLVAPSPELALARVQSHPGTIDLLVTDLVMPGMSGRELCDQVRALRPGLQCLFMSGYTADAVAHRGALAADARFLEKPFTIQAFTEEVRSLLGPARGK